MWYMGLGGLGIEPMGGDNSDSPWKGIGFDPSTLLYTVSYATSTRGGDHLRSNPYIEEIMTHPCWTAQQLDKKIKFNLGGNYSARIDAKNARAVLQAQPDSTFRVQYKVEDTSPQKHLHCRAAQRQK